MPRTHQDIMTALPEARRARIKARAAEMLAEVEGLKALRQTDLYLSTLRRFVEAAGGTLELRVTLPGKGVMHLTGLGELSA